MTETRSDARLTRDGWRYPIVWGVVLFAFAVIVALTAPSSNDPAGRIGIALSLGGGVATLLATLGKEWRLLPAATALTVGGALLMIDAQQYIASVTRGGGVLVLLVGFALARLASRDRGRLAGAVVLIMAVVAAAMFVVYPRLLLSLTLGIVGSIGVAIVVLGIIRASDSGKLTARLTVGEAAVMGVELIGQRASTVGVGEPINDKVLYEGADRRHRFFRFLMLMGFASAIASLGVVADSTAVVIGAMLVAPLLIPLMGMSLALVSGWAIELRNAGMVAGAGVVTTVGTGFFVSAVFGRGVDAETNTQILSRTSPTLLDLFIAVAAGAAGAYAVSRSDVSDALPGVAVSIALVPPLAVVGVTAQLGATPESFGALLLFATSAVGILLMGALVFVVTGTAATAMDRAWRLDWWVIALAGLSVVVLSALVVNTSSSNDEAAQSAIAARIVDQWVADRDYEIVSIDVDDNVVSIVMAAETAPDDAASLADSLTRVFGDDVTLDLRVSFAEHIVIEAGDDT